MVIVGPNNSGKTRVIEDIKQYLTQDNARMFLLSDVQIHYPQNQEDFIDALRKFEYPQSLGNRSNDRKIDLFRPNYPNPNEELRMDYPIEQIERFFSNQSNLRSIIPQLTTLTTFSLDAQTRFNLLTNQEIISYEEPKNFLGILFNNDNLRAELRDKIFAEFGYYFYLDSAHPPNRYTVKLSRNNLGDVEKSLKEEDRKTLRSLLPVTSFGHGIQAFTSILLSVSTTPYEIILIDEPEAFLHPPQALHLGRYISEITSERKGTAIIVTHSPEVLMGCVESSDEVKILRMTYDQEKGTVKEIAPSIVKAISETPKLRSTSILDSFFYKSAIIIEGDSDRVFYSEINRILDNEGIDDTKFLGSYGKQVIDELATPLRKIGIPTAAIFDFDAIKHEENFKFNAALKRIGVPDDKISYVEEQRRLIESVFEKLGKSDKEFFKKEGINALQNDDLKHATEFLEFLAKYGIFIIPQGDLESWLQELEIPRGDKSKWIETFLELIKDKDISKKIKSKNDDIVKFIIDIKKWIDGPKRLGMLC